MAASKRAGDRYAERARVFEALADPHRLRLIDVLSKEGALCGTDLAERSASASRCFRITVRC